MKSISLSVLLLALLSSAALADEAAIRQALGERYEKAPPIKAVNPTPIPGLFEVFTEGRLIYTDAKGDFLLIGSMVDTRSKDNLTQKRLRELTAVKFDSLPLDKAITMVKGKGERKIAVFSDPDCPFCKKLEKELSNLDNLTVHLFLMPLPELHPQAAGIAKDIWCAEDRSKAWQAYMLDAKKPETGKTCDTPIDAIATLASSLNITGTPAVILPNGRVHAGVLTAAQLEAMLSGS